MKDDFHRISIVGLGLIGGSIAKSCRAKGIGGYLVGVDKDQETLKHAREILDLVSPSIEDGVFEADLVILATPIRSFEAVIEEMNPVLSAGTVVTDVGSVKGPVVARAECLLGEHPFVGAHPIAGNERSGFSASSPQLFEGRPCIITPTERTEKWACLRVSRFWERMGCWVTLIDPERHDRIFAALSHLPHLLAYALVGTTLQLSREEGDILKLGGGGFRNFSRIAASPPEIWRDICLMNDRFILQMIEQFQSNLKELRSLIAQGDAPSLEERLRAWRLPDG